MKITNQIINLHNTQDGLFQDVIRQTLELYHIAPPLKQNTIVVGPFSGSEAHWNPKYGRLDHRLVKNEETGEYIPLIHDKESSAVTWHDGLVELSREVFKSPGFLASVLHHEAIHFEQLTTKGQGDEMSGNETEYQAYMKQRSKQVEFQLTESEVKEITDRLHKRISQPDTDFGWKFAGVWAEGYDGLEREKLQGETDFLQGISGLPETTQEALAAFERDELLQRLAVDQAAAERARLAEQAAAERARLAEEARRKKEKEDMMEAYAKAVRWYKFEPIMKDDGFSSGFRSFEMHCTPFCSKAHSFTSAVTLEEARMALLFAYTCHGRGINESNQAALADILVIINKRWSEPDYRDKMDLKTDRDDQSACLAYLHENTKTPIDLKSLDKTAVRFWKDWDKARSREYDREREARRRNEADEARRRRQEERAEERESRGSGPGGGYINPCIAPGKHCWGNNPPHGVTP